MEPMTIAAFTSLVLIFIGTGFMYGSPVDRRGSRIKPFAFIL